MSDDNTTSCEFDWFPLGETWWREAAKQVGASERQLKFAAARYRGASQTQAAREAGYDLGDPGGTRQAGYRVARGRVVENLLALATAEKEGGTTGTVDRNEARRILTRLARGSDPSIRIRALESLAKLDEQDRAFELANKVEPIRPMEAILDDIAGLSPEMAAQLAAENNIAWRPTDAMLRDRAERHLKRLASSWIRNNPHDAMSLARFFSSTSPVPHPADAETTGALS